MLAKAPSLGCSGTPDPACLCKNQNFVYGIRDCATEACGSDAPAIIAAGTQICKYWPVMVHMSEFLTDLK